MPKNRGNTPMGYAIVTRQTPGGIHLAHVVQHSEHSEHHGAHDAGGHHHHEMPTAGRALTGVAVSATLHCLTGCAIGEIAGVAIGTALGLSNFATIALAIALAFLFGYSLTSLPLLRAGLALGAVIPIAFASDTISIGVMEVVDNLIIVVIPGAMDAGLGDLLFWGALSFALFVAFLAALPVNRWLISRGKGHVAVHKTGIHGGPSPRLVGAVLAVAAVFGATVLVAEAISGDDMGHGTMASESGHATQAEAGGVPADNADAVRGLSSAEGGLRVELDQRKLSRGEESELSFRILEQGSAVTDFDVEHARRMHLIVVREDLAGFQHLHPEMAGDGTWSTPITLGEPGDYRVFADFSHDGEGLTLGADLSVEGQADYRALPVQRTETTTASGYEVAVEGEAAVAGEPRELTFNVLRGGKPVHVEPYLGADGHLVAVREGDLAFLHVHPITGAGHGESGSDHGIRFMTEFPSAGRYRLFLQFKHQGRVHTAEFTREASG
jgi:hypothetical protein